MIIITGSGLSGLAFIILAAAYLVLHNYIKKINYVDLYKNDTIYGGDITEIENLVQDDLSVEEKSASDTDIAASDDSLPSGKKALADAGDTGTVNYYEDIQSDKEPVNWNLPYKEWPVRQDKNVMNVLFIGSDTRISRKLGHSDVMIIISINKKAKKIIATSLLRDSYVEIPGYKDNRINIAYIAGGAKLLIRTIEDNFRIKIDQYASVDFFAFMDIVDAIGGITVDVSGKELKYLNYIVVNINKILKEKDLEKDRLPAAGTLHLNGKQALAYVRIRSVGTDFARTARQRKVLEIIFNEAKKLNISQMNALMNKVLPKVTTDFTEGEIITELLAFPDYLKYEFVSWSIPVSGAFKSGTVGKNSDLLILDFKKNIKELYRMVYGMTD